MLGICCPSVYKASASDPDTLTYDQALKDTANLEGWKQAAALEIGNLAKNGTWEEVPLSSAEAKVLPGTWVFKIKRRPD